MRAKEFIMKDAYSFDATDDAAQVSYRKMYDAYARIFERCGLKTLAVEADTGAMGGKFSHEFMVPAETGENEIALCDACNYAANVEKATSKLQGSGSSADSPQSTPERFPTPGVVTIDALSKAPYDVAAAVQIKTLVYVADSKIVLVLMRGDDQLNEAKLAGTLGTATFRAAEAEEIFSALGAHPGSLGAVGVTKFTVYADERLRNAAGMTTGANEDGFHLRNVAMSRDIQVAKWADLRQVQAGEPCPNCGQPLKVRRATEVGHVFKLGTKYSEALKAFFLDEAGKQQPAIMGCYGIGITRTMQAVIEQSHDENGIVWPLAVAPFTVCITPLNVAPESEVMKRAEQLYAALSAQGVDVILDDRNERPGVKFKDSELVGFPIRIGIGEKSLAKGDVEIKPRAGPLVAVKAEEALQKVMAMIGRD
jgi:prolyl-tRNA synthetase